MMPEDLPACAICRSQSYRPGGAYLAVSFQHFTCTGCAARVELIGLGPCELLMFNPTEAHFEYVNRVALSVWRGFEERVCLARDELRRGQLRAVNVAMGLPLDTTGVSKLLEDKETYRRWSALLNEYGRQRPLGFDEPLLPQVPEDMVALLWRGGTWNRIVPAETRELPVPPDPIRVRHDAAFASLFARVRAATGHPCEVVEIANDYYDDRYSREPWYRFKVGEGTVVVGPRKRVISIRGHRSTPFSLGPLRDAAARDDVTWYADGGWKATQAEGLSCEIHAWSEDKAVEYLTLLIASLRPEGT